MADLMKHVGKYGDKPCVVVFRELPEEADQALIVVSDSLEGQLHDDIMSVVDSPEGQESNNISEVFFRRRATDGSNLLETLHANQKLQKVPVDMVKLTPVPNQEIELSEVNAELGKIETGSNPPLKTEEAIIEGDGVSVDTSATVEVVEDSAGEPVDIANNLLAQAELLEQDAKALVSDAEAKKSEAYRIAPELSPKRGPGRPPKSS
jgi:hypothetical protein|tara:strand:- start:361 stop:981 length:621 start_codon:yes stop_codon:yes gene_type:complete